MSNEYYKNLPKKRMGAGAIILNDKGEMLIVKPSYKDSWSIVGGVVNENESPQAACKREITEEIGIDVGNMKLLCMDYVSNKNDEGENLQFVFFGGKLNENEIKHIKLDGKEIVEYKFMGIDEAITLLGKKQQRRIPKCLEALENNTAIYLENGE